MKQQQQEQQLFNDPEGGFNAAYNVTDWGASFVRPFFYHGQGKRAYGKWTFIAFCSFPFLAEYCRSPQIVFAWKVWTLIFTIRWLLPDRSQATGYWGGIRLAEWLSFGNATLQRILEVLIVAGTGWSISSYSLPLSRLLYLGAFSMAYQFRVGYELIRREDEAIHNAAIAAARIGRR